MAIALLILLLTILAPTLGYLLHWLLFSRVWRRDLVVQRVPNPRADSPGASIASTMIEGKRSWRPVHPQTPYGCITLAMIDRRGLWPQAASQGLSVRPRHGSDIKLADSRSPSIPQDVGGHVIKHYGA